MEDAKWARYAALGGVWFVVLTLVGGLMAGAPPAMSASNDDILEYFTDNPDLVRTGAFLSGAAMIGLAWWFGSLWRRMSAAEEGRPRMSVVALLGLGIAMALSMASSVVNTSVALRIDDDGGGAAPFFWTMSNAMIAMAGFGIVIFLAAVTALSFRTGMFPKWTSYIGWLAALGLLIGTVNVATDSSAFLVFGFAGFILAAIYVLVLSWDLWKKPNPAPSM